MYGKQTTGRKKFGISMMAAALLLGAALAAAQEPSPDDVLAGWLGKEFTVESSTLNDSRADRRQAHLRLRLRGRTSCASARAMPTTQSEPWRMDFATPCGVTMTFTRGTRYCTVDDVKTGNAEVLASCHRLRTHDVAMRPSKVKGAVELNDMIAFLVQGDDGKHVHVDPRRLAGARDRRRCDIIVIKTLRPLASACATTLRNVAAVRRGNNVRGVVCARGGAESLRSRRSMDGDGGTRARRGDRLSRFAGR